MFCKYCGKEQKDDVIFCSQCGKQLKPIVQVAEEKPPVQKPSFTVKNSENTNKYVPTESDKSRGLAALLAFFFGEFGAHRFYVGKITSAVWQLVLGSSFFIGLICFAFELFEAGTFFIVIGIGWCVWELIDFIMILCGSFKDKNNLLLKDWSF